MQLMCTNLHANNQAAGCGACSSVALWSDLQGAEQGRLAGASGAHEHGPKAHPQGLMQLQHFVQEGCRLLHALLLQHCTCCCLHLPMPLKVFRCTLTTLQAVLLHRLVTCRFADRPEAWSHLTWEWLHQLAVAHRNGVDTTLERHQHDVLQLSAHACNLTTLQVWQNLKVQEQQHCPSLTFQMTILSVAASVLQHAKYLTMHGQCLTW